MKIPRFLYGLKFFSKTNSVGRTILVSYHHPDSITWRWYLDFTTLEKIRLYPSFGPSYSMGSKFISPSGDFGAWLLIPFVGVFSIGTQKNMWRY
jgi:hypothetical protein